MDTATPDRIAALERVAAAAWPAPERAALGGWLLRAAGGWTGRANSVLPVGDPGLPLPDALDHIASWYAARSLPPRVNVPLPLAAPLDAELDRRGWRPAPPVLVQTARLDAILRATGGQVPPPAGRAPGTGPPGPTTRIDPVPDPDWLALVAGRKGGLPPVATAILAGGPLVGFASTRGPDGAPLAIARGVVDGDWLGLFLIEVAPVARRRGLARAIIGALSGWARGYGARRAYLQVEEHNTPAVTLYRRLGFTTHHRYVSRTGP